MRVGRSRKLKWCARPGCDKVIRRPGCCNRRAICECGFETCFKCGDPYHVAACQVSGTAGYMLHNTDPRVSKCPSCRTPIYKTSGCNHMTCYRCNVEWCWVCHQVTKNYSKHFDPSNLFGCWGMQDIPQSVCLFMLLLFLQLLAVPFIALGILSYKAGRLFSGCFNQGGRYACAVIYIFLGLPFLLVAWLLVLPVVLLYRIYILLTIVLRHFVFCCCC